MMDVQECYTPWFQVYEAWRRHYLSKVLAGREASTFMGTWGIATCCRLAMEVITIETLEG